MDPWQCLPAELGAPFRAELPRLAEQMTEEIQLRVPEFGRSARGAYLLNIRLGVERALSEFADRLAEARGPVPDPGGLDPARVYRTLGRGEVREGRTLDALQSAFRLGARLAWQCLAGVGAKAGVAPEQMYRVAEALFVYIEELAGQSRQGYAEAQARLDGELQRQRERLIELLTRVPAPSRAAVAELARAVHWPLPDTVRVIALRRPDGDESGVEPWPPAVPGTDALVYAVGPEPFLLVPDSGPGTRLMLARALSGWAAAVGPPVALTDAGISLRWARRLLELGVRGLGAARGAQPKPQPKAQPQPKPQPRVGIGQKPAAVKAPALLLNCLDHLPALILLEDEILMRTLISRRLAPLQTAAQPQRDRLAETLLSWLECRGSAPEVARRLGVHPQTVRYRLRHLEELFGDALSEPEMRYELELALRGRALLAGLAPRRP
jgi:hypothetical protein